MSFQDIGRKGPTPPARAASPYRNTGTSNTSISPSAKYSNNRSNSNGSQSSYGNSSAGAGIGGVGIMQPIDMNDRGGGGSNNEYGAISQAILQYQVCTIPGTST